MFGSTGVSRGVELRTFLDKGNGQAFIKGIQLIELATATSALST